jgi:formylglycine-generating enzyme required for sulfatase activity
MRNGVCGTFLICVIAVAAGFSALAEGAEIETVRVGNTDNGGELSGSGAGGNGVNRICGAVNYAYNIGAYEVTAGEYTDFLNAVAAFDTYSLYNSNMWTSGYGCKIQQTGLAGDYSYSVEPEWSDRPVNYVSWGDAARMANWLHNNQPTGPQDLTTTENGAYELNGATSDADLAAITRDTDWRWAIASEDEWYKAAYHKNDGDTGEYFDYPSRSDFLPGRDMTEASTPGNNANYYNIGHLIGTPYYRTPVGEFELSVSPYGTFDQGGNVGEWTEAANGLSRGVRGGSYGEFSGLGAGYRNTFYGPSSEYPTLGFRLCELPAFALNGISVSDSQLRELVAPLLASGYVLSGRGVYDAVFAGAPASAIIADDGDMILGDPASFVGFSTEGVINTYDNTLTLHSAGFAGLGTGTVLGGGTIAAPNGVALGAGDSLTGWGAIEGRLAGGFGSLIEAAGDLTIGDPAALDGFQSDGVLIVADNTVTIYDANQAVLGSLTQLGTETDDGTLVAANGLVVEFGKNIAGRGVVDTPDDELLALMNNGVIVGDFPGAIELTGYVKGVGTLENVTVSGTLSPGFSPVRARATNLEIAADGELVMELGGLSGGSQYDQLDVVGALTLGGTLQVVLLDGFTPDIGDTFDILDFGSLGGAEFDAIQLPELAGRKVWDTSQLYATGAISVIGMLHGDTDIDWDVDAVDYDAFIAVFGTNGDRYTDFNGDGRVDLADFVLMRENFGAGTGASPGVASETIATPEPGTLAIAVMGAAALLRRRRRP